MGKQRPKILYKYFGPKRLDVIKSLRVRFSQPSALNDPFEFALNIPPDALTKATQKLARQVASPFSFLGMALSAAWGARNDPRFSEFPAPARWILVCVLLLALPVIALAVFPFVRRQLVGIMGLAGKRFEDVLAAKGAGAFLIFSCSELWDSVPMWAHYAANHTGFVIGIDPTNAFERVNRKGHKSNVQPRAVSYVESLPHIRLDKRGTDAIFGSKFRDWSYEREWRFSALSEDAAQRGTFVDGHEVLLFAVNPKSIVEITFGLNASQETIQDVQAALSEAGCTPSYSKIILGEGYRFTRSQSLDVVQASPPQPVPSLASMFEGTAKEAYEKFHADARAHPIMKRFVN